MNNANKEAMRVAPSPFVYMHAFVRPTSYSAFDGILVYATFAKVLPGYGYRRGRAALRL
jgi:hypothetical protein